MINLLSFLFLDYSTAASWVITWGVVSVLLFIVVWPICMVIDDVKFEVDAVDFGFTVFIAACISFGWPILLPLAVLFGVVVGPSYLIYRTLNNFFNT